MRLIDCCSDTGTCAGVGICNSDSSESMTTDDVWRLISLVSGIKYRAVPVGITVSPAIHGYSGYVFRWIEPATGKRASKLFTRFPLNGLKRCGE